MKPGPLPAPPKDLPSRSITLVQFSGVIFRTHGIGRDPLYFGKSCASRFDAPDGSFGVLYAGCDPYCAFIETFARAAGTRIITTTELEKQALSELKPARAFKLIDLTQSGTLLRIGADARLFASDHEVARLWSKALHDHPLEPDGIRYPSRIDPQKHALALFEDRVPKIVTLKRESWYAPGPMRRMLAELMEHYQLELIENRLVAPRKSASPTRQDKLFHDP